MCQKCAQSVGWVVEFCTCKFFCMQCYVWNEGSPLKEKYAGSLSNLVKMPQPGNILYVEAIQQTKPATLEKCGI